MLLVLGSVTIRVIRVVRVMKCYWSWVMLLVLGNVTIRVILVMKCYHTSLASNL